MASRAARAALVPRSLLYWIHSLAIPVSVTPVGPAVLLKRARASSCRPSSARSMTCLASTMYCRFNSSKWPRSCAVALIADGGSAVLLKQLGQRPIVLVEGCARRGSLALVGRQQRVAHAHAEFRKACGNASERRHASELLFRDESAALLDLRQANRANMPKTSSATRGTATRTISRLPMVIVYQVYHAIERNPPSGRRSPEISGPRVRIAARNHPAIMDIRVEKTQETGRRAAALSLRGLPWIAASHRRRADRRPAGSARSGRRTVDRRRRASRSGTAPQPDAPGSRAPPRRRRA